MKPIKSISKSIVTRICILLFIPITHILFQNATQKNNVLPSVNENYLVSAETNFQKIYREFYDPYSRSVLVVAHRGDWKTAPENSIKSIESCIEMGVDIVEVDVQKTKDNHLILMHDYSVNRTTDGRGRVSNLTLAQIKKLRLKRFDGTTTNERVPTLEEALLTIKGKCMINLDKASRYIEDVSALVCKTGTEKHVILKGSGTPDHLPAHFNRMPFVPIFMPIIYGGRKYNHSLIYAYINELEPPAYELIFRYDNDSIISPNYVYMMKTGNARIWVNSLFDEICGGHTDRNNPFESWEWMLERGVNIIQTDEPALLLDFLRNKKRHW